MTRVPPKQRPSAANSGHLGHGRKADAVREAAIMALLDAKTIAEAAAQSGIGERTLRRWLAEDRDFQQQYESARHVTFQAALHRVQALMMRAVTVLDDLLVAKKAPAVQLGAARTIVELGLHEHDKQTILRRLNEIEQAQRSKHTW